MGGGVGLNFQVQSWNTQSLLALQEGSCQERLSRTKFGMRGGDGPPPPIACWLTVVSRPREGVSMPITGVLHWGAVDSILGRATL